jgi:type I restriction enzyme S subunit
MEKVLLGRIVKQVRGITYKPGDTNPIEADGFVPLLRAGNIGTNNISKLHDMVFVSEANVKKHQYLREGDILIAASSGSIEIVGKSAYIEKNTEFTFGAFCKVVRPNKSLVVPKYVSYFFQTDFYRKKISSLAQGANINNLRNEHIDKLEIPLPDHETQNKIVALLDKVKNILDKREQTIYKYNELFRATFLEMFGDPVRNEKGWETRSFNEIGQFISGGTPSKSNAQFWEGDFPWVSPKDMKVSFINDSQDHISRSVFEETNLKRIEPNHLLIVVRGMILAHSFPIAINTVPVAINQDMKAIMPFDDINIWYLYECLRTMKPKVLDLISTAGHGTKKFNSEGMAKLKIPIPPKDLQLQFERKIVMLHKVVSRIKLHKENTEILLKSLSQQIFSDRITIDIDAELESLINAVDLQKEDIGNKIDTIVNDNTLLQRLIDRLKEQEFDGKEQYNKAKYILFRIMREDENLVKQIVSDRTIQLTLKNETT